MESGPLLHQGRALMNSLIFGLAPDRVCLPFAVAGNAVVSYATISLLTPFACLEAVKKSGLFSVAPSYPCGPLAQHKVSCPVVPGLSSAASYLNALQRLPGLPLNVKIIHAPVFSGILDVMEELFNHHVFLLLEGAGKNYFDDLLSLQLRRFRKKSVYSKGVIGDERESD